MVTEFFCLMSTTCSFVPLSFIRTSLSPFTFSIHDVIVAAAVIGGMELTYFANLPA